MSSVELISTLDAQGFVPAGVLLEDEEAHICLLGEDGWPHYTSVPVGETAQWRRAIANLADPNTATLGRFRRAALRKPVWLGVEVAPHTEPPFSLLSLVLLPRGRLSLVTVDELDGFRDRLGLPDDGCRFDRAELLAHYVARVHPPAEDELLQQAANDVALFGTRRRSRA